MTNKSMLDLSTLHLKEAMRALCFECCSDMVDGNIDCGSRSCPLYAYQPYRKLEPDLTWIKDGRYLWSKRETASTRGKITTRGFPGRSVACAAKCYECMAGTRGDCAIPSCPLYKWKNNRSLEPDLAWRIHGSHLQINRKKIMAMYGNSGYQRRHAQRLGVVIEPPNAVFEDGAWNEDGWEDDNA